MEFADADKITHPVETQWHYPIMTKHGFVPETKEAIGFVRSYLYKHENGRAVRCTTGASADYWAEVGTNSHGFWRNLESHISKIV